MAKTVRVYPEVNYRMMDELSPSTIAYYTIPEEAYFIVQAQTVDAMIDFLVNTKHLPPTMNRDFFEFIRYKFKKEGKLPNE